MRTTNYRTLFFVVLAALILNIAFLAWIYFRRPPWPERGNTPPPVGRIAEQLQFDDRQRSELHQLVAEHRSKVMPLRREMFRHRRQLGQAIRSERLSDSLLQAETEKLGAVQASLDSLTMTHFAKIRSVCTPDQQKRFDALLDRMLRHVQPPGRAVPNGPMRYRQHGR